MKLIIISNYVIKSTHESSHWRKIGDVNVERQKMVSFAFLLNAKNWMC